MISPNELRIGNLITIYGVVHTVNGQMIANIEKATKRGKQLVDDPSPITLTPEWLERLGAKRKGNTPYYQLRNLEIDTITGVVDNGYSIINEKAPLKFVHSLQNLYRAIEGQELQLKPYVK